MRVVDVELHRKTGGRIAIVQRRHRSPAFAYEGYLRKNMLVIAERIVEAVSVFHLDGLPNKEAALLCQGTFESGTRAEL